jgi:hypothetical protein
VELVTTEAAVDLAARGLAVFPVPPGGRRPAGPWHARCLTDPQLVRERWRGGDNIGVGCRASHVVGLDLDVEEADGPARLADLASRLGEPWPTTLTVATPSGGLHLYFRVSDGCTIGSFSGARSPLGPGIDVRGPGPRTGGYLIGPGSIVGGITYAIVRDEPVRPLPRWIADRLQPRSSGRKTSVNAFDQMAANGQMLGIGIQIQDVLIDLKEVLEQYRGDVERACGHKGLLNRWTEAAGETRSALLLNLAWAARTGQLDAGEDTAGLYAADLHTYARTFEGDSEAFHGARFPAMPLPGQAGALASSLGFDRDDVEVSLKTVLLLLAVVRTLPRPAGDVVTS